MKNRILKPVALCAILAASLLAPAAQAASTAELVDFGKFEPPASGGEFVEVNIRSNLISLAARLAEKHEPDAAALLRSVHSVRVNVVGVDSENRPALQQRIQQVRTDLEAKGWERVVTARKDQDDVAVYLKMRAVE